MKFVNQFIENWSSMIKHPIIKNAKQGFLLSNGMKIFFKDASLSMKSRGILKRHYESLNK
jgi:hypothetical protein